MNHWHVSGTATTCPDCGQPYRFVITDHEGRLYGCRTSHYEAMNLALRKAKHWAMLLDPRFPIAA